MLSNMTRPIHSKGFAEYYRRDFKFLTNYLLEFSGKLDILVNDCLHVLYQRHCITTISLEFSSEKLRLYKIALHPEFSSIPLQEANYNKHFELYQDIRNEDNAVCSIIVGPELLHWWCHRIIWEAAYVIGYKSLH